MEKEIVEKINDEVYAAVCNAVEKIKVRGDGQPIQAVEFETPAFAISREQRRS